jgi:hypothetical protein
MTEVTTRIARIDFSHEADAIVRFKVEPAELAEPFFVEVLVQHPVDANEATERAWQTLKAIAREIAEGG